MPVAAARAGRGSSRADPDLRAILTIPIFPFALLAQVGGDRVARWAVGAPAAVERTRSDGGKHSSSSRPGMSADERLARRRLRRDALFAVQPLEAGDLLVDPCDLAASGEQSTIRTATRRSLPQSPRPGSVRVGELVRSRKIGAASWALVHVVSCDQPRRNPELLELFVNQSATSASSWL